MKMKNVEDIYPLSSLQEGILFHTRHDPTFATYFEIITGTLHGDVDLAAFAQAWQLVIDRHAVLRTAVMWKGLNEAVQVVRKRAKLEVNHYDWRSLTADEQEKALDDLFISERTRGFDLSKAPLMRLGLVHLAENSYRFVWVYHHGLIDGWSASIVFNDVFNFYEALTLGMEPPLSSPPSFRRYIEWVRKQDLDQAREYWTQTLKGFRVATPIPFVRDVNGNGAVSDNTRSYRELESRLTAETTAKLVQLSRQNQLTLNTICQGAWALLLNRYTGEREVVFGAAVSGRSAMIEDIESMVGLLVNTLPVRIQVDAGTKLIPWLKELQRRQWEMLKYEYSPLIQIRGWSEASPSSPLFQSIMGFENHPIDYSLLDRNKKASIRDVIHYHTATGYPINLTIYPEAKLMTKLLYDFGRIDDAVCERILSHFTRALIEIAENPERKVSEFFVLTPDEQQQMLFEWNNTTTDYPRNSLIHREFELQVERTPRATAIVFGDREMTYDELNRRANQLAHHLASLGVGPEVPVALCLERSLEMVVALLAVLKTGGYYVPLDRDYPIERVLFMLDDSAVPVVLTQSSLVHLLPMHWSQVIELDTDWEAIAEQSEANLNSDAAAENLAYVMYTSGSTGAPKGVAVTHRGVLRLVKETNYAEFGSDEVFLQLAPITFDASTFEVWGSLLNGGRLVIMPPEPPSLPELGAALRRYRVTTLWLTAGLFHLMVNERPGDLEDLRQLLAGGDVLSVPHVQTILSRMQGRVINGYGPTENTTFTCCYSMTAAEQLGASVPIGYPISNTQVYLLSDDLEPVPVGANGELYTGGDGLARGYHNTPELTAERFVPHPFGKPGERLYRTGDLARYLPDGRIEFLGRLDHQVKIRGFRIELDEIEVTLGAHPAVRQCVVLARDDSGRDKQLVAYVMLKETRDLTAAEMREYLGEHLPEYMIPPQLVVLETFPLNANGKVDRHALPSPNAAQQPSKDEFVAPQTDAEQALAEIWQLVLGVERVSVNDNFFDLGGDSIRSIQVHAQAEKRGYDFSVRQILQHQTIAELAREAKKIEGDRTRPAQAEPFTLISIDDRVQLPEDVEDAYPLSFLQRGMLYHSDLHRDLALYHVIFSCRILGNLDIPAFQTALQQLTKQHPVLRTSFDLHSYSRPLQLVHRDVTVPFSVTDLRHLSETEQKEEFKAWEEEEKQTDFDISIAPILRVNVFIRGDADFRVTFCFHHAILDGWSLSSMFSELFSLMVNGPAQERPPLVTTFRDFITLEQQSLESQEARDYWTQKLSDLRVTALPPREGPPAPESARNVLEVHFGSELVDGLKSFGRLAGVSLKSVLLAAHCRVLGLLSGQSEVTSGLVSNGRPEEADGDRALGLFLNTIPFSLSLKDTTWLDLAQAAADAERELGPHRRYPLPELQKANGGEPLFEATFNYTHFHILEPVREAPKFKITEPESFSNINYPFSAGFDLNNNSELILILESDSTRLSPQQIDRISNYYSRALSAIVADPFGGTENSWALSEEERQRILVEWNETSADYPRDICLHQLIEAQVERTPEAVALISQGEPVSYRELNERANQLAHYLMSLGVGPDVLAGVMLDRSVEMVVTLLGILKAGGAYVPLDPDYPRERLRFMLDDARPRVLLTQPALLSILPETEAEVLFVDERGQATLPDLFLSQRPESSQQPEQRTSQQASLPRASQKRTSQEEGLAPAASNLAYVIYTSGSSGTPKGAMVTHGGVVNCLLWMQRTYALTPHDRMLCKTTLNFDPSVWEVFWPLLTGGQVVLSKPGEQQNVAALLETIVREQVTLAYFVPSLLSHFLAEEEVEQAVTLKQVICGGESLPNDLVNIFYERLPHATLHHSYGPTETAIASSETVCERNSPYLVTPIGRPLANTQLYVLDELGQPVPIGVTGELYIGGSGLGRGYLNQPALTATKFVPDPFTNEPGRRLYRTGDVVRYLADGNLEFHGRRDEQVKLRGVRIELGEIENVIRAQAGVRATVVMMRGDALVAYVVGDITTADLRHAVAQHLPVSMVPAAFVSLAELPLLPNGKIDRAALPEPESDLSAAYVKPRDEVETLIAEVWAEVLELERVGIHDDFFALGGDSLTATQVMARLFDVFHVDLGLRSLFETPTVAALAESVNTATRGGAFSESLALMPRTRPELLPLSFAQQRLWFLEQLESAGDAYHIPVIFRIRGRLDVPALERVIDEIVRRHESLRTTFHVVSGEAVQVISSPRHLPLPLINLSDLPEERREAEAVLLSTEQVQLKFDLSTGPLVRARLLRLSEEEHVLQITLHHLIADGWSVGVLARETRALYEAFTHDKPSPLPDLAAQYADFALWQREWLRGDLLESQVAYWREQLGGALTAIELPTDHVRPPAQSFHGARIDFEFSSSLVAALHKLSRREGATIFMTLLTAYSILLSRYADQEDVVVGTPIANRHQRELEEMIGFFVNTLALRVNVQPELTFRDLLRNVRETTLNAYANQDVPFERLVEELQPPRELNRNPIFQVMLGVENTPHRKLNLPGIEIGIQEFGTNSTRFDLECYLREDEDKLLGYSVYNTDLFERQTVEKMLQHFQRLLELAVEDPKQQIRELRLLTPAEDHQQLVEWNNTRADYPRDKCVHELFAEQVARTPANIAVEFGDQRVSYSELNRRAGEVAVRLQKVGVGPNSIVGICLERSPAMLIALLGVLKAGGAYLPLDPEYPKARLAYMLDDSGSQVLITHTALRDRFSVLPEHVLYVDDEHSVGGELSNIKPTPENLAFLIYTSGSTGTPKGAAMPHRALANLIHWQITRSGRPAPRTLQFASVSFDVSFQEIFSTWCAGGTLIMIDEEVRRDVERLWSTLARKGVERLFLPCVALQSLAEVCIHNKSVVPRLREIVSGGEQLKITPQIRQMFATLNGCLLDNHYGPTETHVVTTYRLPRDEASWPEIAPIGRPTPNAQIYVLDPQLKPGPVGVIGEVFIGGDSLSTGYLNHPDATAEKYIPNPYSETPGARMYRTGDLARLLSDGTIEFFGRRDGQLKIRGYRVEIGEIEAVLAGHPSINEAVVVAKAGESGAVRLVAYARVREAVAWMQLRQHLKERLPEYMIPATFVAVDAFPLTPSGKIDRRGLLALAQRSVEENVQTEALSPTAELLAGVLGEVLGVEHVNAHDNFFDLGGHSLLATRVVSRIREAFSLELPLRRLFEYPTVFELAAHIDDQLRVGQAAALPPIRPQSQGHTRPLSFAQQRIWYWEQLEPGTPTYNLSSAFRMEGDLDLALLERSFNEIVRRHETLRTSFTVIDGEPVQVVAPKKAFRVSFTDLSSKPAAERETEARRLAGIEALQPFILAKSPLLRVSLLRLSPQEHIAVVAMHHIISDGWSLGLFIEEVTALYEAYQSGKSSPLAELPVQYGDFAQWQNELLQPESEVLESQIAYWKEQLRDAQDLKLPIDRPRPAVYDPRGAFMPLHYSAELSQKLKKLSRREDVTLFMTLLSAFSVLLHSQSGQEDIVVGIPIANRTRLETEKLIGFFVNMLVLRTDLSGDPTFRELLQRAREVMLGAYSHQDVPFAKLVRELNVKRDVSRNPLFQVAYIFDNTAAKRLELTGLTLSPFEFQVSTAPFDLSLYLTETPDGLNGSVLYNTALFDEQTVRRLFDHYENLLQRVVADPNQRLSSFNFLAKALAYNAEAAG